MFLKLTFSKVYRKHFYIIERETSIFKQYFKEKFQILNNVLNIQILTWHFFFINNVTILNKKIKKNILHIKNPLT